MQRWMFVLCKCYVTEHNMYYYSIPLESKDFNRVRIYTKYLSASLKHLRIHFSPPKMMWSSGEGSSEAAVRKRAQLGLCLHPFSLWSKDAPPPLPKQHKQYKSTSSGPASVSRDHQNFNRSNRPRFRLLHLFSRVELYTHLTPARTTGGVQEEMGQSPAMQPSTNGDFSLCVLVRDLVLDLVCVPWVAAGHRAERGRVPAAFNHPPARLHLHVQASLHAAHLHVLVQMAVHVTLCRGQFHLREGVKQSEDVRGWMKAEARPSVNEFKV